MKFWDSVRCLRRSRLEEIGKADRAACGLKPGNDSVLMHGSCAGRYNFFKGCPKAKTCTIILRGGAEQFTEETERSLHDAIMIVRRAIKVRSLLFKVDYRIFQTINVCLYKSRIGQKMHHEGAENVYKSHWTIKPRIKISS